MAIQPIEMYSAVCDICGEFHVDSSEFAGHQDAAYAEEVATDYDWVVTRSGSVACELCAEAIAKGFEVKPSD